jgi:transcriptional regulator GlxA family with amidase domain
MDRKQAISAMTAVALIVQPGSTLSSVMTTLDMFAIARRHPHAASCRFDLLSQVGGEVALSPLVKVATQALPPTLDAYDAVLLPGFFAEGVEDIVARMHDTWAPVLDRLRRLPANTVVGGSCYATFALAESGLLDGQRATTTWWLQVAFQQRYPQVRLEGDKALVDAGRVLTGGAMTAHTDLTLHLLRRLFGAEVAKMVGSIMLIDGARVSQRPFMALPRHFPDPLVQQAVDWLTGYGAEAVTTAGLADALHVSYRTLHRRFVAGAGMPPLAYLQAVRVERAKEMLEATRLGLEQIIEAIGYSDTAAFRRLFMREVGLTPAQYRQRFRSETG